VKDDVDSFGYYAFQGVRTFNRADREIDWKALEVIQIGTGSVKRHDQPAGFAKLLDQIQAQETRGAGDECQLSRHPR
jgi:hypothetical protein